MQEPGELEKYSYIRQLAIPSLLPRASVSQDLGQVSLCVRDSGPIQLLTAVSLDACLPYITRLVGAHGRNCFLSYRKALSKSQSLRGIIVKSVRTETPGQCYRGDSDFK